jgi:hypothetical protein
MSRLVRALRELALLFFDDGSLALVIVAILASSALALRSGWLSTPGGALLLVGGTVAALVVNVIRTARRQRR